MSKYKFKMSPSKCLSIMAKSTGVPKGAQTYCKSWLKEKMFGRKAEFKSKYTDKGNETEQESIDFLINNDIILFGVKNEKLFKNDFLIGTPDLIQPDCLIDVKNSWSVDTFPYFDTEIPSKAYWWQGQCYMELTGHTDYKLIYLLSDTPEELIEKEIHYATKDNEFLSQAEYKKIEKRIRYNHTYNDLEPKQRYKVFEFKKDNDAIEQIKARVGKCQEYIDQKIKELDL